MSASSSKRAWWALVGALLVGAASGPALARGAKRAPSALETRESLRERLVYRTRGAAPGLSVAETRHLRATVRVPLKESDRRNVSETTLVGVRVGTFSFEAPLSDARDWSPGRMRATFVERSADVPHRVLTRVTAHWSGEGLVVDVRSIDDAPVADAHHDDAAGALDVVFDGAARFGGANAHFAAEATGRLRRAGVTVLGSPLSVVRTTLAGRGRIAEDADPADDVAPVVSITSPASSATLTAAPIQVTGTLRDNRTIVRVTYAIGTEPEVDTSFTTDAATGYLDDVSGTFSFPVNPGDGRTTVRVRAYDAAGNAGLGAVDFLLTSHGGVVLAAARDHVVVKDVFGRVQEWGYVGGAQVATPQLVTGLADVRSVAAGVDGYDDTFTTPTDFSLALLDDGTVRAWGVNTSGELGDGTKTASATPVTVQGLDHVAQVAAYGNFAMALGADGTVWSWGYNGYGNLGDGTTTQRSTPGPVPGLPKIRFIATGWGSAYAVDESGDLWVWGTNTMQLLGYATNGTSTPVKLLSVSGIASVVATGQHVVAVASDGTAWSWGMNASFGAVSQNSTATYVLPAKMLTEEGGIAVGLAGPAAVGYGHSLLVTNVGGVVACNGRYTSTAYGQLGDGTTDRHQYLIPLPTLAGVRSVSGGLYSSYAVLDDESVMAWGQNNVGQLGDGSGTDQFAPVPVTLVP